MTCTINPINCVSCVAQEKLTTELAGINERITVLEGERSAPIRRH